MTLPATAHSCRGDTIREGWCFQGVITFNDLSQQVIQRADDTSPLGVVRLDKLGCGLFMAVSAVLGGDNYGVLFFNLLWVMCVGSRIFRVCRVTFRSTHISAIVCPRAPWLDNKGDGETASATIS